MSLPRSAYVWLVLLILSLIGGKALDVADAQRERTRAVAEYIPSAADFTALVEAEHDIRLAFYYEAMSNTPVTNPLGGRDFEKERRKSLDDAATIYRRLSTAATAPNLARRVLILDHARGEPLDEKLLTGDLTPDLYARKKTASYVQDELTFWHALYGGQPAESPLSDPKWQQHVEDMDLGYLEDRLLADLYKAAGDARRATTAEDRFQEKTLQFVSRAAATNLLPIVGFFFGLVYLGMFLYAALKNRWTVVRRVATRLPTVPYGIFVDAFLAYLTSIFLSRLVFAGLVMWLLPHPTRGAALGITLLGQVIPAILAATYLIAALVKHAKAPKEGPDAAVRPLAEIGLATNGQFWSNVGYGIAGYCATLPLMLGLGKIAQLIFQNNPNTTPNLAVPLISSEKELAGRIVLFLLVAVSAPLFEELFFRGALYTGLRARFGWGRAVVLSAILFATLHPMQDWLPIFGLGVSFAVQREMRQSLIPSMVGHFLQNSLTFLLLTNLFGT